MPSPQGKRLLTLAIKLFPLAASEFRFWPGPAVFPLARTLICVLSSALSAEPPPNTRAWETAQCPKPCPCLTKVTQSEGNSPVYHLSHTTHSSVDNSYVSSCTVSEVLWKWWPCRNLCSPLTPCRSVFKWLTSRLSCLTCSHSRHKIVYWSNKLRLSLCNNGSYLFLFIYFFCTQCFMEKCRFLF